MTHQLVKATSAYKACKYHAGFGRPTFQLGRIGVGMVGVSGYGETPAFGS